MLAYLAIEVKSMAELAEREELAGDGESIHPGRRQHGSSSSGSSSDDSAEAFTCVALAFGEASHRVEPLMLCVSQPVKTTPTHAAHQVQEGAHTGRNGCTAEPACRSSA